jgi:hypothetical protein
MDCFEDANAQYQFIKIILSSNFRDLTQTELGTQECYFNDARKFIEKSLYEVRPYNHATAFKLFKNITKEHSENILNQNYK